MLIERECVSESTLEAFADEHGLVMVVTERKMDRWQRAAKLKTFLAQFKGAEVGDGMMLRGTYGEGDTEDEAIRDYAQRISLERLVVDAMEPTRRGIDVPRLVSPGTR